MQQKFENDMQLLNVAWEEFKYRHEHYWKTYFKFGLLNIAILAIPFLKFTTHLTKSIENLQYYTSATALAVTIISFFLLSGENKRLIEVSDAYKKLRLKVGVPLDRTKKDQESSKRFDIKLGNLSLILFIVIFVVLIFIELSVFDKNESESPDCQLISSHVSHDLRQTVINITGKTGKNRSNLLS